MKAITLWQPWASLIALGHKSIETRGWATSYRGPLAIHAATHCDRSTLRALVEANRVLRAAGLPVLAWPLPRGAVVATARLVCCEPSHGPDRWPVLERAFGDLSEGRWAWRLADVRGLDRAVRCKGSQGFWEVPDRLLGLLDNDGDRPGQPSLFSRMEESR